MKSVLEQFLEEARKVSVNDIPGPDASVPDGGKVVGKLSDVGRRLFALRRAKRTVVNGFTSQVQHLVVDLMANPDNPTLRQHIELMGASLSAAIAECDAVSALFWAQLRSECPEDMPLGDLVITKGWNIAVAPPPELGLLDLLTGRVVSM